MAGPFVLLIIILIFGVLACWVVALVEVIRIPEQQFRAAGTDKMIWILIVGCTWFLGAFYWLFVKRRDVRAAAGRVPPLPPVW